MKIKYKNRITNISECISEERMLKYIIFDIFNYI